MAQLDGSSIKVIVIAVVCTGLKCSRHLMYVVPANAGSWPRSFFMDLSENDKDAVIMIFPCGFDF